MRTQYNSGNCHLKAKKSQVEALFPLIVSLIGVGIVLVVGFLIFAEAKTQILVMDGVNSSGQNSSGEYPSYAFNGTSEVQNAMQDIPGWLSIIVITVIGALLIGLVQFFRGGR